MATRSRIAGMLAAAVATLGAAAMSQAALQLITPAATGTAYGSQWCNIGFGFDAQPTWDGTSLTGGGEAVSGQGDSQYYQTRFSVIDFGANYADIQIYQTWTKYRKWSAGDVSVWVGGFWTSSDPGAWPDQTTTPITNIGFSFESQTALADTGNTEPWVMDTDLSAAPLTVPARYLVLATRSGADPQNRGEEYAILGTVGVTPEPAAMALVGLGSLAILRRRR